jgi:predicted N-acetyltransferase YhbS
MLLTETKAGLRLCRLSSWNQMEDDWRIFLDTPGCGGRLAEKDGEVVGSVAFLRYGASFSWLSMMLVDPKERGAGIGSRLMESALDALASESCVRLDATPLGEPMYRRYGFGPEGGLTRMVATVTPMNFDASIAYGEPMRPGDFADVFAWDQRIFGADRSALLASFYGRAPELAFVARNGGDVLGYCFGRPGYLYQQLGPIVAENAGIARNLVERCFSMQAGKRIAIDAPEFAAEWTRWLESAGFRIERRFLRMRRGENLSPGCFERQFAIAGPEFG